MLRAGLLAACSATMIASSETAALAQVPPAHAAAGEEIVIEHAEVMPGTGSAGQMTAYLTVWNGTKRRADLTSVTSPAFGTVIMHRLDPGGDGAMPLAAGIMPIPARAEMVMRRGGLHLVLEQPMSRLMPGDGVPFDLAFDDGTAISTVAIVRQPGGEPVDHHHDEDDG